MTKDPLDRLEASLGYRFRSREILSHALTHSSRKSELQYSNERLEFLGDAILGGVVSDFLYRNFPDYAEGDLTRVKSHVVSHATLVRIAKCLELGEYLLVAKGVARAATQTAETGETGVLPKTEAKSKDLPGSLLSDALEAIIAAVYLDSGIEAAYDFVMRHLRAEIERASESACDQNYKSALQQYAQRNMGETPIYRVVAEEGPDHVKSFEIVTVIANKTYGKGRGNTKKAAEQMAARQTLAMFDEAKGATP